MTDIARCQHLCSSAKHVLAVHERGDLTACQSIESAIYNRRMWCHYCDEVDGLRNPLRFGTVEDLIR